MPLHPDLQALLQLANQNPRAISEMAPAEARLLYEQSTELLDLPGPELRIDRLQIPARDGQTLAARLYRGNREDPASACLLFFHGGGYVLGGLDSHDSLCRSLAELACCAVLAVDYRRAPEHRFPTAFQDAEDASLWLREQGPALGLDTDRIAYGGDSVGGTLSTALTLADRAAGRPQPRVQILLYPCTGATLDTPSHERYAEGFLLERRTLRWMFAQYLRSEADARDWRFAPLEAENLEQLAPAHIALAEFDPLHDEGQAYAERLRRVGVQVTVQVYAGMVHDFARLGAVVETAATLHKDLAGVLSTAFGQDLNNSMRRSSSIR